jgi:hypothetical protein
MTNLKQMIADQQARVAASRAAYAAYSKAKMAHEAGSKELTAALVEASGRKVGDVLKTTDGREAMISYFRLTDDGTLIAACDGKTKAGKWSSRVGFPVTLNVKIEEDVVSPSGEPEKEPTGSYFAKDGTLMNADGTRSIFDDVDR